ncbi:MAG: chemotaxis protein CheB [Bacteroidota bacterium]
MSTTSPVEFPVVGIGASAGGLKAIQEMLGSVPSDTGMAFIIVQHLSRRFKSLMAEILSKDTRMPIVLAEDKMKIEANHVYLIPAGHNLTVSKGRFVIEMQGHEEGPHFVIDMFLHSLGRDIQENAVAVILSGTGSDGSRGIKTVKEAGGIVIVQEPQSGEFDGMPLSAIDTRIVDFILPPKLISEQLYNLSRLGGKEFRRLNQEELHGSGDDNQDLQIQSILKLVQKYHDVNFSLYKINTIKRRIDKQMSLLRIPTLQKFYSYLVENPSRIGDLLQELLIGVTEFFRDPKAYQALDEEAFPLIITPNSQKPDLRIWVCGCSTGEEVYSIAMAIHEYCDTHDLFAKYTILATDVDERALNIASKGQYPPSRLSELSEDIIDKYFAYNGEKYEVKSFIRDSIIFARNDATVDPPFINLDMISCRNLLIYFQPEVQRRLLLNFHFGLKKGGVLWLGSSENITDLGKYFITLHDKWKVFQVQGETPRARKHFSIKNYGRGPRYSRLPGVPASTFDPNPSLRNPRISFSKLLLDRFAPTCALIDDDFSLLYLAGGAGKYLHLPDMELNQELTSMVSQPTVFVLRDALRRLLSEKGPLVYPGIEVSELNPDLRCDIYIEKVNTLIDKSIHLVEWRPSDQDGNPLSKNSPTIITATEKQADAYHIIQDLQTELRIARQEVQNSLEELETSNEELQASNEELLAANEELQSTNEELQSVNEELYTVNSELQARNRDLTDANITIDALLESTNVGTLFLNKENEIRLFTPPIFRVLKLMDTDIGTNIDKFRFNWRYPNFLKDLKKVQASREVVNSEVLSANGKEYFLVQLNPYFKDNTMDGVVVNLIDITEQKAIEQSLVELEKNQRKLLDLIPMEVCVVDLEGEILFANTQEKGNEYPTTPGRSFFKRFKQEDKPTVLQAFSEAKEQLQDVTFEIIDPSEKEVRTKIRFEIHPIQSQEHGLKELLITAKKLQGEEVISNDLFEEMSQSLAAIDHESVMVSIKDDQYRYLYANSGFTQLLNKPKQYVIGSNDFALFPNETASQFRLTDEWVMDQQQEKRTFEIFVVGGKKSTASILKFPSQRKNGEKVLIQIGTLLPASILGNGSGNAEQIQGNLEKMVQERTAALIRSNQEMRTITRSMAHDLRSPLRAINTFGELLTTEHQNELGNQAVEYLTKILTQSNRMGQILDGLLSYVKLGTIEYKKEWIDSKSLAHEVWSELKFMFEKDEVNLIFRDCPPIWGDMSLCKQVLTNLFSNAIKYRKPNQKGVIEFGAFKEGNHKEHVFFVKDNGIGFPSNQREKIFGVFERLHQNEDVEGYGIGLSIVKFSPRLLDAPTLLIKASVASDVGDLPPDYGWGKWVPNLEVVTVSGDHYTLLSDESAENVGRVMEPFLYPVRSVT